MTGELVRGGIVVGFALFAWTMIWAATPESTVTTDISATLFKRD